MGNRGWIKRFIVVFALLLCLTGVCIAEEAASDATAETIDDAVKDQGTVGSTTDSETIEKEAEAMSADGFNAAEQKELEGSRESFGFQAEVSRLMDIIINSLYSNREIFIREMISNSADALDKIRFKSLTDKEALGDNPDLEIKIKFDKEAKTITLTDTGVGMTKAELIANLGTVAKSGTTDFIEAAVGGGGDALSLIGQFGVGFYSVFLVADRVVVVSKNNDDPKQHIWESTASAEFTVSEDPRGNTLGRGTAVILHLKEDAEEFLNESELEKIVTRYSQFVNFPIHLFTTTTVDEEVPVEEEEEEIQDEDDDEKSEEGDDDLDISEEEEDEDEVKPKTKTIQKTVHEWKRLNDVKAIWTRSPREISTEEYDAFYESLTSKVADSQVKTEGYLDKTHFIAEGEITFKTILYIPKHAQRNLYDSHHEKSTNVKLYVRKVLIADSFDDFLPRYMGFVHGIVDSDDLPLNVARETLAQSRVLKVMSKKIVRKVLEMLRKMAERGEDDEEDEDEDDEDDEDEDEEEEEDKAEKEDTDDDEETEKEEVPGKDDYANFWKAYSKSIKLGIIDDRKNKSKLSKLLRFLSSTSGDVPISLESYVDRMKDDQKNIYYITGESLEYVKSSPFLERLKRKGYEVLYLVDPIDEYVCNSLTEFDGIQLASVTKDNLKLGDEDSESFKTLSEDFKPLTEWLKTIYDKDVEKVVVSNRIYESPCVLVTGQYGWTSNMERIMKAQTLGREQKYMSAKKTMEINPYHPIMVELKAKQEDTPDDDSLKNLAKLLYDSSLMASGFQISETADFSNRIYEIVAKGLGVDPNAEVPDEVIEEEEEDEDEVEAEEEEAETEDDESVETDNTEPAHEEHVHEEL